MKLTRKHFAIAASVVMLAIGAAGCKRADNSTEAGGASSGASGAMMNNPAATGAMSPSAAAPASATSQ